MCLCGICGEIIILIYLFSSGRGGKGRGEGGGGRLRCQRLERFGREYSVRSGVRVVGSRLKDARRRCGGVCRGWCCD